MQNQRETLSGRLVKALSERIGSGHYPMGSRLPSEQDMIDEFGVSRTVVREAIADLRASGRVTTRHGVGAFVVQQAKAEAFQIEASSLSAVQEIVAVLELRIALEAEAAVLAAQRRTQVHLDAMHKALATMRTAIKKGEKAVSADLEFHRQIAEAAQNPHFLNLFNYLGEMQIPRARLQSFRMEGLTERQFMERIQTEHEQICYAIERQDPEAARAALRLHLSGSRTRLLRSISQTAE